MMILLLKAFFKTRVLNQLGRDVPTSAFITNLPFPLQLGFISVLKLWLNQGSFNPNALLVENFC